jgi:hypothetical protein
MESGSADGGMPQLRRGSSARRLQHSGSSGGGGGPAITEMEALIRFVELMGRSAARPDVPECRAALLAAAGEVLKPHQNSHLTSPQPHASVIRGPQLNVGSVCRCSAPLAL